MTELYGPKSQELDQGVRRETGSGLLTILSQYISVVTGALSGQFFVVIDL